MNKSDIIKNISAEAGITKAQATSALQAVEDSITENLIIGKNVTMVGFGTFSTVKRKARKGRNPQTGDPIDIPAKTAVKFKAGKGLDQAIN